MLSNILDKVSFWSLFFTVLLLPIFIIPFTGIPVDTNKGLIFILGLVLSVIFWAASRFSDGKIIIPKSKIILSVLALSLVLFLSSLFSQNSSVSLFGVVLDTGTFWYIFSASLLLIISSLVVNNEKKGRFILKGLIISFFVVFVFQIFRFFIPEILNLGLFTEKTDNLVGSWNSLGIFASLSLLMSVFILEFYKLSKRHKILLGILAFISLFIILNVNFILIWQILGVFSLILFVYKLSNNSALHKENNQKIKFPLLSFSLILVSLLFIMSAKFIGGIIPGLFNLVSLEVNPSLNSTFSITKNVITSDPVFGMGPNKFTEAWALYKPIIINSSQFWNTSFVSAFGLLPTFMSTVGVLGILLWIVFLFFFLIESIKNISVFIKNRYNNDLVLYFFMSLFLLVNALLYPVSSTLFILSFVFIGISIGISSNKLNKNITINFLEDPRKSFFSILALVLVMILSAGLSFKYFEKFASVPFFTKTLQAGTIEDAERNITKALILNKNDLYFRTASQVYVSKINSILSDKETLEDDQKVLLQNSLNQSISYALSATEANSNNYLNYELLGFVYKNALSFGVEDTASGAIEAYTKASLLNPKNPLLQLEIARVYFLEKNFVEARNFGLKAIELKPDFIEGLIFLSQLADSLNNKKEAISYAEKALNVLPGDKQLTDYLNSLKQKTTIPTQIEDNTDNSNSENN